MKLIAARHFQCMRVGCIACIKNAALGFQATGLHVELHHLNEAGRAGNKRRGDKFTIPLCTWHHRGVTHGYCMDGITKRYGPSLVWSKRFRAVYGLDDELLADVNDLIAQMEACYG